MFLSCANAEDVLKAVKDKNVQMIDLRFTDLPGVWQHFSVPPSAVNADTLSEGIGFDGSSIRGFQEIQESDMLVVPDPTTAFLDPFTSATTLVLICNIRDPITGESPTAATPATSPRRPRHYLKGTGLADTAYFGPEAEFFVFNDVRYGQGINYSLHTNRFDRGQLEHRQGGGAEPRPQATPEGGIFPGPSDRQHARSSHRDGADDGVIGDPDRSPSP